VDNRRKNQANVYEYSPNSTWLVSTRLDTFDVSSPCISRLRNDLYCVEWGVKLYSLTHPCILAVLSLSNSTAWRNHLDALDTSNVLCPASKQHPVVRIQHNTYYCVDRAFSAAGPRVWNSLPTDLRQLD